MRPIIVSSSSNVTWPVDQSKAPKSHTNRIDLEACAEICQLFGLVIVGLHNGEKYMSRNLVSRKLCFAIRNYAIFCNS